MTNSATKHAHEYRKPNDEEWKHILEYHLEVQVCPRDGATTVSVVGECDDPKCPTHVHSTKYCKRPPC